MKSAELAHLVFKPTGRQPPADIGAADHPSHKLLASLDGRRTLAAVANLVGMDLRAATAVMLELQAHRLVATVRPNVVTQVVVGPKFMEFLIEHYTQAVGPMAGVVVEDVVHEMGYTMDRVPKQRLLQLVNKLGLLIFDESKRREFESGIQKQIL